LSFLELQEINNHSSNSEFFLPSITERLFLRGDLGIGVPIDGSVASVNPQGGNRNNVSPKNSPPREVNIRPSPRQKSRVLSEIALPGEIHHVGLPFARGDYLNDEDIEEYLRNLEHEHRNEVGKRKQEVQERNEVVHALIKTGSLSSDSSEKVARFVYEQYESMHQQAIRHKPVREASAATKNTFIPPTILEQPSNPSRSDHTIRGSPRRNYSETSFRQGESPRR
jgi:hypothetical protein